MSCACLGQHTESPSILLIRPPKGWKPEEFLGVGIVASIEENDGGVLMKPGQERGGFGKVAQVQ